RREVRDDDDAATHERLGREREREARDDRPGFLFAEIDLELKQLVLFGHLDRRFHDADAQVDRRELVVGDRRDRRRGGWVAGHRVRGRGGGGFLRFGLQSIEQRFFAVFVDGRKERAGGAERLARAIEGEPRPKIGSRRWSDGAEPELREQRVGFARY